MFKVHSNQFRQILLIVPINGPLRSFVLSRAAKKTELEVSYII
jgi:hypothetical protein